MSLLANSNAIETGGYQISRSVRIRASATPYFDRTPASTSGNNTWTFSCWVKRGSDIGSTSTQESIMGAGDGGGAPARYDAFGFYNDTIQFFTFNGSVASIYTTAVYRDPSAWYHLVCRYDDTQSTASNRVRIYVNGVLQTLNSPTYPNQNYGSNFNTTYLQRIAANTVATNRGIDGYLAEVIMVSGQSLDPSSFGETDANTGVWVAKKYVGTYGTNGFYLNFSDNSAATSTTIGKDYSGNGNNWTPNNISVTAGTTYDSMLDVPSGNGYADGGNGRGNYCVLNPLQKMISGYSSYPTFSNGNLAIAANAGTFQPAAATMGAAIGQKCYFEVTLTGQYASGYSRLGICNLEANTSKGWVSDGTTYGAGPVAISSWTTNDVLGIAIDNNAGAVWISKNGTWLNSAVLADIINGVTTNAVLTGINYTASVDVQAHTSPTAWAANFGQRPFTYTPPTGFKALNTTNLPTPTIGATSTTQAGKYMNAVLYTGTGSSNAQTGVGFQPDLVWIKSRSGATDHGWYDAVRGVQKQLESNTTTAETTETTGLTAFGSDGFTVGALAQLNTSSATYVAWNWKANGTGVSNTAGTITSTVSANTTSGFSIVTYTGTGANATVGHGLGVAPKMIIAKARGTPNSIARSWFVYQSTQGAGKFIYLDQTAAVQTGNTVWQGVEPTSTVFSLGTEPSVNFSAATYVAYCFSEVAGYSRFGSFTGNGSSTDGPMVFLGFRPRFVLIKRTDAVGNWRVWDTSRSTYNVAAATLLPNSSGVELTTSNENFDILSNGFKLRNSDSEQNANGGTYIYAAFAESPFKYSNAR
jgi:hypothetical protein